MQASSYLNRVNNSAFTSRLSYIDNDSQLVLNLNLEWNSASNITNSLATLQWQLFSSQFAPIQNSKVSNFSTSVKDNLLASLIDNIPSTISLTPSLTFPEIFKGWVMMALSKDSSSLAFQGRQPNRSSQKMIPMDQTSHFRVQSILCNTCGAIQQGVPTWDLSNRPVSSHLDIPKSAIFKFPSLRRMFAGFRSRCTIPSLASSPQPFKMFFKCSQTFLQPTAPYSVQLLRSPQHNSITIYMQSPSQITSYNFTVFSWFN